MLGKVFSVAQIKKIDKETIKEQGISSYQLMQRAGERLALEIQNIISNSLPSVDGLTLFCGKGNNAGDGIEVAKNLSSKYNITIYLLNNGKQSDNLCKALEGINLTYVLLENEEQINSISIDSSHLVIDAVFGTGLSKEASGLELALIKKINKLKLTKIAIDIPSGLSADLNFIPNKEKVICADYTIALELPKLCYFFPESAWFCGDISTVNIDLSQKAINNAETKTYLIDELLINRILKFKNRFAHKGSFGHVAIVGASRGKVGASTLSLKAALKSGCGLVTGIVPRCAEVPIHASFPEAMLHIDSNEDYITLTETNIEQYDAIGIGPGLGVNSKTYPFLLFLLVNTKTKLILDADALNILSNNKNWLLGLLKSNHILTPHPIEFDRLTQKHNTSIDRYKTLQTFVENTKACVVLKGHHTIIYTPDGNTYINTTGNEGMATAGSGDVLTGIISSLAAQAYSVEEAAILGVYFHGLAGDNAAKLMGKHAVIASDIIANIRIE